MRVGHVADFIGSWSSWINIPRRIIGFGVHAGTVDGAALCRMFNRAIQGNAGCRTSSVPITILLSVPPVASQLRDTGGVVGIKSIPYVPLSHPLVERLIGTLRREYLDHLLFWTTGDLENKLLDLGPISTTIARIPHWKRERRLRRCHEQSQISVRFDGSPTADPYKTPMAA